MQAPFFVFTKYFCSVMIHVKILKGAGGADGVLVVQHVHIHQAHGLARADHMALGGHNVAGDGEKVVDVGAAGDGGALLRPGKARGQAGGGVHQRADHAAVDVAVEIAVVRLDHDAGLAALPRGALQQLCPAIGDEAHHAVLCGLRDFGFFHVLALLYWFILRPQSILEFVGEQFCHVSRLPRQRRAKRQFNHD